MVLRVRSTFQISAFVRKTHNFFMSNQRALSLRSPRKRIPLELDLPDLMSGATLAPAPDAAWISDLGLTDVVAALSRDRRYAGYIRTALMSLPADPQTTRWRQATLRDFVENPVLVERVERVLPMIADLRQGHALLGKRQRGVLLETVDRLSELNIYLTAIRDLAGAFQDVTLHSEGLRRLRDALSAALESEAMRALAAELPALQAPLGRLASLTVGINLDADLKPISVLLLGINERPFGEAAPLLERLLGLRTASDAEAGIAPLHGVPSDPDARPLNVLFQDLDRLTTQVATPIARELERYTRASSAPLHRIEDQLAFFTSAARLAERLRAAGVPLCFPELLPAGARETGLRGLVNAALALRNESAIASDARFDAEGRFALLTGPNSGGKTTYLQAVGLAHVMAQAGLFVTAAEARLAPVDLILTHFPALETRQQGRLSEEAARLRQIFVQATETSLVLLNESLSSTTPGEALALAGEVVAALRGIGVRGIFATHLVELAERIPQIEAAIEGDCRLYSLVADVETTPEGRLLPTFQVKRGAPLKVGYAQEIARKYGISLAQIMDARRSIE